MRKIITDLLLILLLIGISGCDLSEGTIYYPNFLIGENFNKAVQTQNLQNCSLVIKDLDFSFTFDNGFKRKRLNGTFDKIKHKKNGLINYEGTYAESGEDVLLISTSSTFDDVMFCVFNEGSMLCIGFSKDDMASQMHIKPSGTSNVDINDDGIFFISEETFK